MPYARRRTSTYKRTPYRSSRRSTYKPKATTSTYRRRTYVKRPTSYKPRSTTYKSYSKPAAPVVSGGATWDRNVKRANDVVSMMGRFLPFDLKKDTSMMVKGVSTAVSKVNVGNIIGKVFHL